jgi:methionine biosynthesis protein MetW
VTLNPPITLPPSSLTTNLQTIADFIPHGITLLDIGCAKGNLLAWLAEHKQVKGRGIEINKDKVQEAISRGLSVVQGDAEYDLIHYQDGAYDYIILNQILQQMSDPVAVLRNAARVARHIIVSVPNFGHWRSRWYLAWHGKMPVTSQLDYEWYETPNIHFCTLRDFTAFVKMLHLKVDRQEVLTSLPLPPTIANRPWVSNMLGEKGIFLLSSQ